MTRTFPCDLGNEILEMHFNLPGFAFDLDVICREHVLFTFKYHFLVSLSSFTLLYAPDSSQQKNDSFYWGYLRFFTFPLFSIDFSLLRKFFTFAQISQTPLTLRGEGGRVARSRKICAKVPYGETLEQIVVPIYLHEAWYSTFWQFRNASSLRFTQISLIMTNLKFLWRPFLTSSHFLKTNALLAAFRVTYTRSCDLVMVCVIDSNFISTLRWFVALTVFDRITTVEQFCLPTNILLRSFVSKKSNWSEFMHMKPATWDKDVTPLIKGSSQITQLELGGGARSQN